MRRALGFIVLGSACAVVLGAVGLFAVIAGFDPNVYKGRFSEVAAEATGRRVIFHESLETVFFPQPGVKTGRISLSNLPQFGEEVVISADNAFLSLSLDELWSGLVIVDAIRLDGVRLDLAVSASGRGNWEYGFALESAEADRAPLRENSPEASPEAVPEGGGVTVTALREAASPAARAKAAPASHADYPAGGALRFRLDLREIECADGLIRYTEEQGKEIWRMRLNSASLRDMQNKGNASLQVKGMFEFPAGEVKAELSLDARTPMDATALNLKIRALHIALEGLGETPLRLESKGTLVYDPELRALVAEPLQGAILFPAAASGQEEAFRSEYRGHATFVLPREGKPGLLEGALHVTELNVDALGKDLNPSTAPLEEWEVKGAPNFTRPKVNAVRTDAGGRLPGFSSANKQAEGESAAAGGVVSLANKGLSFDTNLGLELALNVDTLTVKSLPLNKLDVKMRLRDKQAAIPYSFELFGQPVVGSGRMDFRKATPSFALASQIKKLPLGKVLHALESPYGVSGVADAVLELATQGKTFVECMHHLRGQFSFQVLKGEIRDFTLIPPDLPRLPPLPDTILFNRLSANGKIAAGTATSNNIAMEGPAVSCRGGGSIHLVFGQMDLGLDFMIAGRPPRVPVNISGPYGNLACSVDKRAYMRNVAESDLSSPAGED